MAETVVEQKKASIELTPIGRIRSGFDTLDQCPRASRFNPDESLIELQPEYAEGLLGIEGATHIIVQYWFDKADRAVLRRNTPYDGVVRGVFAIRSPDRPNPIALSIVRLLGIEGTCLRVSGLDCLDGTPLLDIKPYIPAADCFDDARIGFECPTVSADGSSNGRA